MSGNIALDRLAKAAAWLVRLAESPADCTGELEAWLAEHPQNRAAWERVRDYWALFGQHVTAPELTRVRRAALTHAQLSSSKSAL